MRFRRAREPLLGSMFRQSISENRKKSTQKRGTIFLANRNEMERKKDGIYFSTSKSRGEAAELVRPQHIGSNINIARLALTSPCFDPSFTLQQKGHYKLTQLSVSL